MSSSEAYLDSLLSALNEESNSESSVEQDVMPISDDPNKALSAEEVAALFEQANIDLETGDEIEVSEQIEEEPEAETEDERAEEPEKEEEIAVMPISDDPNKALSADEIAALFAQANVDLETGDELEETEQIEESEAEAEIESVEEPEKEEEIAVMPISDDPNKALSADEIAALFAQANVDLETGDELEETEQIEESEAEAEIESVQEPEAEVEIESVQEPKKEEEIAIMPISDDPNKALSADEIAALFAQADISMETENSLWEDREMEETQENMAEELSIDDMLAQMSDEGPDSEEEKAELEVDVQGLSEEIEIDMDNPEELELLLSLGERPDWSARKEEAEKERKTTEEEENEAEETIEEQPLQSAEDILAAMSEENSDLQEINSLLNKLDNNELVGDGIEESILVDFAETDYEEEQDPWLDELLGSKEKKKKEKKKKEKKKFSIFKKKKKDGEQQTEIADPEVALPVSEQDTEDVTEILQNFSENNSEIPFDLFAASEEESEEELDLIALVEADKVKNPKESKASEEEKGFWAKMWDVLTEEVAEEEEKVEKKEKKEKKKKKTKKNGKKAELDADDNEGILEELDAEEDTGKKGKKTKKAKKAKKQPKMMDKDALMDLVQDSKKLPMKMVLRIFALCCSVMLLVLCVNQYVPNFWSLADARNAFYKRDYKTTYQEMSGKKLSEADQRLYEKTKMVLQLNHKLDAYDNYKEMNMPVEALDSLLSGYMLWQKLSDKIAEYGAEEETEEIKAQIVETLSSEYQISEQKANEINALNDYDYTLELEEITGSLSRQNSIFYSEQNETSGQPLVEGVVQQEVQQSQEPTENVLSEEEVK